ncbi:MAG: hypothetical protein JJT95_09595 [Pararhodobacter sp.]|nr:hypothetical protein [Pararhodobacter sp.]
MQDGLPGLGRGVHAAAFGAKHEGMALHEPQEVSLRQLYFRDRAEVGPSSSCQMGARATAVMSELIAFFCQ